LFPQILWLAVAGALGTVARYGMTGLVGRVAGTSFPWGTLAVNMTGCFLVGLLWSLFESRWPVSGQTQLLLLVGFAGGFTTFSAFVLESGQLAGGPMWMHAAANVALQNVLGFAALFVGVSVARVV
jgi:CrcB protein